MGRNYDLQSYVHNQIQFNVNDEVEVVRSCQFGGASIGMKMWISVLGTYNGVPCAWLRREQDESDRYWCFNELDSLKPVGFNIFLAGKELNDVNGISVARPDDLRTRKYYALFAQDKQYNDYTDKEFELAMLIFEDFVKRSANITIQKCMKKWVDACPKDVLEKFYKFLLTKPACSDTARAELDARFA